MKEKELDNLIANWVTGEISEADRKKVNQWIAENPDQKSILDKTQLLWDKSAEIHETIDFDADKAWAKVEPKLKKGKVIPFYAHRSTWAAAASVVILFGFGLFLVTKNQLQSIEEPLAFSTTWNAPKAPVAKSLEDGSVVTLNKGAKLSMPNKFTSKERHVKLEGEASFDVKRMPEKPFIIDAGPLAKVQVLGTSFNVKANADGSVEVKVLTGKVKLFTSKDKEVILLPDDVGYFDPKSNELSTSVNNDPNYDMWRTKKIVFTNTELVKVVEVLNGFYESDIKIDSKGLKKMRLTATFTNESLDQVLELIKESLEIDVVKSGPTFTFVEKENIDYQFE